MRAEKENILSTPAVGKPASAADADGLDVRFAARQQTRAPPRQGNSRLQRQGNSRLQR